MDNLGADQSLEACVYCRCQITENTSSSDFCNMDIIFACIELSGPYLEDNPYEQMYYMKQSNHKNKDHCPMKNSYNTIHGMDVSIHTSSIYRHISLQYYTCSSVYAILHIEFYYAVLVATYLLINFIILFLQMTNIHHLFILMAFANS